MARPVFGMSGGTYTTERAVIVTVATPGATIRYTRDGTDPTEVSTEIASGATILVGQSQTLKAKAWKTGMPVSATTEATYVLKAVTPTITPFGGTFTQPQMATIATTTADAVIRYTTDGSVPGETSALYAGPLSVGATTMIKAVAFRTGWASSDVATAAFTMNFGGLAAPVANVAGGTYEGSATVTLSAAAGATIRYTTNGSDATASSTVYSQALFFGVTTTLKAKAFHPDYAASTTSTDVYTIRAIAPSLSLASGGYAPGTVVTITGADPAVTIRITLTGVDPVSTDTALASGTSLLVGAFTLKARAFKAGNVDSTVASATYSLSEPYGAGSIAAGGSHTVLATPQGVLYAWGAGASGQIGDGATSNRTVPALVQTLTGVKAVSAGMYHTLALTSDGRVFAWGSNGSGKLGDGTTQNRTSPTFVSTLSNVVAVAAGSNHSLALTATGEVYSWGAGATGVLGLGSTTSTSWPTLIPSLADVVAIAAGDSHSLAVTAEGAVYAWGANWSNQLGDGTSTMRTSPTLVNGISDVAAVSAGTIHSVARLRSGAVYVWGAGGSGQLGLGNTSNRNTPTLVPDLTASLVAAGGSHTLAVRDDGAVVAWGANGSGQIGDGTMTTRTSPVPITGPTQVALLTAGGTHSAAVGADGTLWTWGAGSSGQLGDGSTNNRVYPEAISAGNYEWRVASPVFSVASGTYTSDRSVVVTIATAGATIRYTQDGNEPTESSPIVAAGGTILVTQSQTLKARAWKDGMPASATTTAVYTLKPVTPAFSPFGGTFSSPQTVTISTTTPGATLCYTTDGAVPTETSTPYTGPLTVGTTTTLKAVAFKTNWANSDVGGATITMNFGTLAAPTADPAAGTSEGTATVVLSAAAGATIRYTSNGTDPSASSTIYSQPLVFGVTTTLKAKAFHPDYAASTTSTHVYTIRAVAPALSLASGSYAPGAAVALSSADPAVTIRMTLTGVDPTGTDPAVASGTTLLVGPFTLKARAFKSGNTESVVAAATYTLTDPYGPGSLAAGASHAAAVTPDGLVYGWGAGASGQIGDGSTSNRSVPTLVQTVTGVKAVSAGSAHTLALTSDGRVLAWGANGAGRLGDGTTQNRPSPTHVSTLSDVVAIAAGGSHSLALTSGGLVYAWGAGNTGALGLGSTASESWPTVIPTLTDVVAIAAGDSHSLAVTGSGAVYAWGANNFWQLGDGSSSTKTSPVLLGGIADAVAVAAGSSHSLARLASGEVYAWGSGVSGQLGMADWSSRQTPARVLNFAAAWIAAGGSHSLALRDDGVLTAWGANGSGQLGDTTITARFTPTPVSGPAAVAWMAAGSTHSVAVTPDGHLWTWGAGSYGQLGDGTTTSLRGIPADVRGLGGTWGPTPEPALSLGTGSYNAAQVVTVTNPHTSAVMHYTTNGDLPTEADAVIASGGTIPIDRTLTLRVRAWAPGFPASQIVAATYTLQPLAPAFTPPGGTYAAAQAVTIATATETAVLRFTLDGSDPTAESAQYSAPIAVSTYAVLKARAFRADWSPSDAASATYAFEYGTLSPPSASSPSGLYAPDHQVTLSAGPGETIRYTTDGTDPTAASAIYAAPLSFLTGPTTLKARAYKLDWAPSTVATWSYQITTDFTPPSITASVSPAANANGWYTTEVTITFTCTDSESGVATCPGPETVSSEGFTSITREAVDNVGNRASATVAINLDRNGPALTVHNAEDGIEIPVGAATVELRGNAVDLTSGVESITCNGAIATLEGQRYTCAVPVGAGTNQVQVAARDAAGNHTTRDVVITVSDPPAPTSITITPATMTMLPGDVRPLKVVDQAGRPVSGGTFTVANPLIAEITVDEANVPSVRALLGGETTITLTRDALTAEATVTVLPEGTLEIPNGTTLWALPPVPLPQGPIAQRIRGRVLRPTTQYVDDDSEPPALFYVEHALGEGWPATAVATTWDGRQLWTYSRAEEVNQFAADSRGGLILKIGGDIGSNSDYPGGKFLYTRQTVRRLDGLTGATTWEYLCLKGELSNVAIHPEGTVYVVETKEDGQTLIALDGASGGVRARVPLTGEGRNYANATAPLVRQNGHVVVVAHRWREYWNYEEPQMVLIQLDNDTLGHSETVIDTAALSPSHAGLLHFGDVDRLIPFGNSLLLSVTDRGYVFRLDDGATGYTLSQPIDLRPDPYDNYPQLATQFVVGPSTVHALVQSAWNEPWPVRPRVVQFEPGSMTAITTSPMDQQEQHYFLHSAGAGGGAMVTGPEWGNIQEVLDGYWAAVEPAVALRKDAPVGAAETESPYWAGNIQGGNAPPITYYFYLDFKADWYNSLTLDGFTESELYAVQNTARATVEEAFQGYAVKVIIGTFERANQWNRRVDIDGLGGTYHPGETLGMLMESKVHMGALFFRFKGAFDCGPAPDCTQTPFAEMPQKTGRSRAELLTAFGRGTGATAAHEIGHQEVPFTGVRRFTFDVPCQDCYDFEGVETGQRFPRVYFLGPLRWSEEAKKAMPNALPR